ncbi:hypothetical protein BDZ45DRAFT_745614 [Acephala macrosclerotiorum]|nr:hypothetical protein BDZ45DRAFT_745614 [Acephala macrosclerotiorum]
MDNFKKVGQEEGHDSRGLKFVYDEESVAQHFGGACFNTYHDAAMRCGLVATGSSAKASLANSTARFLLLNNDHIFSSTYDRLASQQATGDYLILSSCPWRLKAIHFHRSLLSCNDLSTTSTHNTSRSTIRCHTSINLKMSTTSLSTKETELLANILAMMGGIPQINYQVLGDRVGIKLARNCRASAKKLFAKIIGELDYDGKSEEEAVEGSDDEAATAPAKKKATKAATAKKVSVKKPIAVPAKKGVGKMAAPKKVAMEAAKPKKVPAANTKAKGKGKKNAKVDEDVVKTPTDTEMAMAEEDGDADSELSDVEDVDSDGLLLSFHIGPSQPQRASSGEFHRNYDGTLLNSEGCDIRH